MQSRVSLGGRFREVEREIDRFLRSLSDRGLINDWRLNVDYTYSLRVCLKLADGRECFYSFSISELEMGGIRALHYWLDRIDHDLSGVVRSNRDSLWDSSNGDNPGLIGWNSYSGFFNLSLTPEQEKANEKARDLFKMVAGAKAYETLDKMKPLPITGSQGTAYTLHNRATYCVERVKDQAKLCAVVPGVPLWDHLLGIKLMIEHDEPKFLKTANVSAPLSYDQRRAW